MISIAGKTAAKAALTQPDRGRTHPDIKKPMKTSALSLFLFSLALILTGCEEAGQTAISGELLTHSDCKSNLKTTAEPDSLSCAVYSYDAATKVLQLTHINAGFNCCPGTLSCSFKLLGDTIRITEEEQEALCSCNCLFDMEMEISGVERSSYVIEFIEPYAGDMDALLFEIDLAAETDGSFCVTRKSYPWGMSAYQ